MLLLCLLQLAFTMVSFCRYYIKSLFYFWKYSLSYASSYYNRFWAKKSPCFPEIGVTYVTAKNIFLGKSKNQKKQSTVFNIKYIL